MPYSTAKLWSLGLLLTSCFTTVAAQERQIGRLEVTRAAPAIAVDGARLQRPRSPYPKVSSQAVDGAALFPLFSSVSGVYSEKASHGGVPGIGHPRFATVAAGGDLVVAVSGLQGWNGQPTRVAIIDADAALESRDGVWPGTPADMRAAIASRPDLVLADIAANPPAMAKITGVPRGTKLIVITGFEGLTGDVQPPPSQTMIVNTSQLPPGGREIVPSEASLSLSQ